MRITGDAEEIMGVVIEVLKMRAGFDWNEVPVDERLSIVEDVVIALEDEYCW